MSKRKPKYIPHRGLIGTRMEQVPPVLNFRNPLPMQWKRWWNAQGFWTKMMVTIIVLGLAINVGAGLGEIATRLLGMK